MAILYRQIVRADLKALRRRYRLTQADVAAQAGMKQPEVSAAENGIRTTPDARARILTAIRELARPEVGLTPEVRSEAKAVFERYGAENVRIFGSVAKGTTRPGSDIDFVAQFPATFSFFDLVELESELEDIIGVVVNVVSDSPRAGDALEEIRRTAVPLGA